MELFFCWIELLFMRRTLGLGDILSMNTFIVDISNSKGLDCDLDDTPNRGFRISFTLHCELPNLGCECIGYIRNCVLTYSSQELVGRERGAYWLCPVKPPASAAKPV